LYTVCRNGLYVTTHTLRRYPHTVSDYWRAMNFPEVVSIFQKQWAHVLPGAEHPAYIRDSAGLCVHATSHFMRTDAARGGGERLLCECWNGSSEDGFHYRASRIGDFRCRNDSWYASHGLEPKGCVNGIFLPPNCQNDPSHSCGSRSCFCPPATLPSHFTPLSTINPLYEICACVRLYVCSPFP
jgi:hypothetical protein